LDEFLQGTQHVRFPGNDRNPPESGKNEESD